MAKFSVFTDFIGRDRLTGTTRMMDRSVMGFARNATVQIDRVDRAMIILNRDVDSLGGSFNRLLGVAGLGFLGNEMLQLQKEVEKTQSTLLQFGVSAGKELTEIGAEVRAVSKQFDVDLNETILATNAAAKGLKIPFAEASAFIQEAFLTGANANNELLDSVREYSPLVKEAGLSTNDFLNVLQTSVNQGIFSDKGIDVIKEANERLRDMTPAGRKAIDAIGLSSREILKSLNDGSLTTFKAMQMISRQMATLPPSGAKVGAVIANVFGGPGIDAGLEFLLMLDDIEKAAKDMPAELSAIQEANKRLLTANTQLQTELGKVLGPTSKSFKELKIAAIEMATQALVAIGPFIVKIAEWVSRNKELTFSILKWVGIGLVSIKVLGFLVSAFSTVMTATRGVMKAFKFVRLSTIALVRWIRIGKITFFSFGGAVKFAAAAQWVLNAAVAAFPVIAIIALVLAFIAVMVKMIQKWDEWGAALSLALGPLGFIISLIQSFRRHWDRITGAFRHGGILAGLKSIKLAIFDALLQPVQQLIQLINKIPGIDIPTGFIDVSRKVIDRELDRLAGIEKATEKATRPPLPAGHGVLAPTTPATVPQITPNIDDGQVETTLSPAALNALQVGNFMEDMKVELGKFEILIRDPQGIVAATDGSRLNASVDVQVARGFNF